MNKNAIKTSLMFFAIIFFTLMGRLFFQEHESLVLSDEAQAENNSCETNKEPC